MLKPLNLAKNNLMKKWLLTGIVLAAIVVWSCNNEEDTTGNTGDVSNAQSDNKKNEEPEYFELFASQTLFRIGDSIVLSLHFEKNPDSTTVYMDGKQTRPLEKKDKYVIQTSGLRTGHHQLMFINYYNGQEETDSYNFELLSDVVPGVVKVKVQKTLPHDKQAYTQGLFYENGFLYEGTGQWGQSSLRKVKPENYEIVQSYNLPDNVFGEGIVSYQDEIIQLTWQAREAFVYDKATFKLKNRFTYGTEGWGITNLGDSLIMSDGSNVLYVLNPDNFTVLDKIEVYDNQGPVRYLNELENINGSIYANVYQTDTIVVINPASGKVMKKIDCSGLLTEEDKFPGIDVLNGIAYDRKTGRIFITGKNWPKLFVVEM